MATITRIYKRLTHKYKPAWSHLDRWDCSTPVTIKELQGVFYPPSDPDPDPSDDGRTIHRVVMMKDYQKLSTRMLERMLWDHYKVGGCGHEYDCCGCQHNYVDVTRLSRREFLIKMEWRRNY